MADSSDSEDDILPLMALYLQNRRKKRRFGVHDTLRQRRHLGEYHRLVQELKLDSERFFTYFRMTKDVFNEILELVGHRLYKKTTNFREPICPEQRLAICLRFLATGDSYNSIAFSYRVGQTTVANVVKETCTALWDVLQPIVMPVPDTRQWLAIAQRFQEKWQFHHCIGAADGKHVRIQAPSNSGSLYFNYKKFFSLVLLALIDADCKFIFVDIGSYGSSSDGGIFANSALGKGLEQSTLNIPPPEMLPDAPQLGPLPYVAVGDEAFPLKNYLMRPYPGRSLTENRKIFNYRLSRARRVSENAFGILAQKFRIFLRVMSLLPENAENVVKAATVLHNFLRERADCSAEANEDVTELTADSGTSVADIPRLAGNRPCEAAMRVRDTYCAFYNSPEGQVPWQTASVRRGLKFGL